MKYRYHFMFLLFFALSNSCQKVNSKLASTLSKDQVSSSIEMPEKLPFYSTFFLKRNSTAEKSGQIAFNVQGNSIGMIGGIIYDASIDFSERKIGDIELLKTANPPICGMGLNDYNEYTLTQIKSLYGKTCRFRFAGNERSPMIDTTIYIPKQLNLKVISSTNKGLQERNGGLAITWDADYSNENGVVVVIEPVDGGMFLNENGSIYKQDATTPKHKKISILKDDGGYSFTQSDLEGFPSGLLLWISIYRGNYTVVDLQNGGGDCLLYGADNQEFSAAFR